MSGEETLTVEKQSAMSYELWEDMRRRIGGPEVQVGFLVRSTEFLKRRHSTSLGHPKDGEKSI